MFSWAFLDQRLTFNSLFFFLMESIHKHAPLVFFVLSSMVFDSVLQASIF